MSDKGCEWISVDDKLPGMGVPVLEFGSSEYPTVVYRVNDIPSPRWCSVDEDEHLTGITYWMPFPEPPTR